MKDILQTIVAYKQEEVRQRKAAMPLSALREQVERQEKRKACSMRHALALSPTGIIAEFKRKNLRKARRLVDLPLLRKDFLIDEYQLYEAKLLGADAVLLIAAILTPPVCRSLAEKAHELGLETLLEIHREEELVHLSSAIDMLGVNNRNLGTFHTDIANAKGIIRTVQSYLDKVRLTPLLIAESGIHEASSVRALRNIGYQGFLIGEAFMRTKSPGVTLGRFVQELV